MIKYPLGEDFMDILLFAIFLRWIFKERHHNGKLLLSSPVNGLLVLFGLWTFLELWFGALNLNLPLAMGLGDPRVIEWKNFILVLFLYFLAANTIKDVKHMKIILVLMALTMLIMGRSFYTNVASSDHYTEKNSVGYTFGYLGANELGAFYGTFTIIMVCLALNDSIRWRKILFGLAAFVNHYCVAFLFSRSGYVAIVATWLMYGLFKDRKVFVILVVCLILWQSVVPVAVQERIMMTKTDTGLDITVQQRYNLWRQAEQLILQNPVTGLGFNTIAYLGLTDEIGDRQRNSLHNGYLQYTVEFGVVGMLLFLIVLGVGLLSGWRLYRLANDGFSKALGLGFACAVMGIVSANFFSLSWCYMPVMGYFWICCGLVVGRIHAITEEMKNGEIKSQQPSQQEVQNFTWQALPITTKSPDLSQPFWQ